MASALERRASEGCLMPTAGRNHVVSLSTGCCRAALDENKPRRTGSLNGVHVYSSYIAAGFNNREIIGPLSRGSCGFGGSGKGDTTAPDVSLDGFETSRGTFDCPQIVSNKYCSQGQSPTHCVSYKSSVENSLNNYDVIGKKIQQSRLCSAGDKPDLAKLYTKADVDYHEHLFTKANVSYHEHEHNLNTDSTLKRDVLSSPPKLQSKSHTQFNPTTQSTHCLSDNSVNIHAHSSPTPDAANEQTQEDNPIILERLEGKKGSLRHISKASNCKQSIASDKSCSFGKTSNHIRKHSSSSVPNVNVGQHSNNSPESEHMDDQMSNLCNNRLGMNYIICNKSIPRSSSVDLKCETNKLFSISGKDVGVDDRCSDNHSLEYETGSEENEGLKCHRHDGFQSTNKHYDQLPSCKGSTIKGQVEYGQAIIDDIDSTLFATGRRDTKEAEFIPTQSSIKGRIDRIDAEYISTTTSDGHGILRGAGSNLSSSTGESGYRDTSLTSSNMLNNDGNIRSDPNPATVGQDVLTSSDSSKTSPTSAAHVEALHVRDAYASIAPQCRHVRQRAWPNVRKFIEDLPSGALVADVGCGSGRYLDVNPGVMTIGSDVCASFVEQARGQGRQGEKGHEVMMADNLHLPYRDGVFDAVVSVGVVHHFASHQRRVRALQELARVVAPGGRLMVYVWAFEQIHRKFESQDVLIPWVKPDSRGRIRQRHNTGSQASSVGSSVSEVSDTGSEPNSDVNSDRSSRQSKTKPGFFQIGFRKRSRSANDAGMNDSPTDAGGLHGNVTTSSVGGGSFTRFYSRVTGVIHKEDVKDKHWQFKRSCSVNSGMNGRSKTPLGSKTADMVPKYGVFDRRNSGDSEKSKCGTRDARPHRKSSFSKQLTSECRKLGKFLRGLSSRSNSDVFDDAVLPDVDRPDAEVSKYDIPDVDILDIDIPDVDKQCIDDHSTSENNLTGNEELQLEPDSFTNICYRNNKTLLDEIHATIKEANILEGHTDAIQTQRSTINDVSVTKSEFSVSEALEHTSGDTWIEKLLNNGNGGKIQDHLVTTASFSDRVNKWEHIECYDALSEDKSLASKKHNHNDPKDESRSSCVDQDNFQSIYLLSGATDLDDSECAMSFDERLASKESLARLANKELSNCLNLDKTSKHTQDGFLQDNDDAISAYCDRYKSAINDASRVQHIELQEINNQGNKQNHPMTEITNDADLTDTKSIPWHKSILSRVADAFTMHKPPNYSILKNDSPVSLGSNVDGYQDNMFDKDTPMTSLSSSSMFSSSSLYVNSTQPTLAEDVQSGAQNVNDAFEIGGGDFFKNKQDRGVNIELSSSSPSPSFINDVTATKDVNDMKGCEKKTFIGSISKKWSTFIGRSRFSSQRETDRNDNKPKSESFSGPNRMTEINNAYFNKELASTPTEGQSPIRPTVLDFKKKRLRRKGHRTEILDQASKDVNPKLCLEDAMTLIGNGAKEEKVILLLDDEAKVVFNEMRRLNFSIRKFPLSSVDNDEPEKGDAALNAALNFSNSHRKSTDRPNKGVKMTYPAAPDDKYTLIRRYSDTVLTVGILATRLGGKLQFQTEMEKSGLHLAQKLTPGEERLRKISSVPRSKDKRAHPGRTRSLPRDCKRFINRGTPMASECDRTTSIRPATHNMRPTTAIGKDKRVGSTPPLSERDIGFNSRATPTFSENERKHVEKVKLGDSGAKSKPLSPCERHRPYTGNERKQKILINRKDGFKKDWYETTDTNENMAEISDSKYPSAYNSTVFMQTSNIRTQEFGARYTKKDVNNSAADAVDPKTRIALTEQSSHQSVLKGKSPSANNQCSDNVCTSQWSHESSNSNHSMAVDEDVNQTPPGEREYARKTIKSTIGRNKRKSNTTDQKRSPTSDDLARYELTKEQRVAGSQSTTCETPVVPDARLSRYYHLFREGEMGALLAEHVPNVRVMETFYDHANWCIVAEKL